jgi:hypothetical protein
VTTMCTSLRCSSLTAPALCSVSSSSSGPIALSLTPNLAPLVCCWSVMGLSSDRASTESLLRSFFCDARTSTGVVPGFVAAATAAADADEADDDGADCGAECVGGRPKTSSRHCDVT